MPYDFARLFCGTQTVSRFLHMMKGKNMLLNFKTWRPWLITVDIIIVMTMMLPFLLSGMVCRSTASQICKKDVPEGAYDVILILGCGIKKNGVPSDMLQDRMTTGLALYQAGVAPKILLSGDNERNDYNEIAVMKRICLEAGVPEEDILTDRYGLSTYDSIVRARVQYGVERAIIVTQTYHLHRALYIAKKMGIEAVGVDADIRSYRLRTYRELREVLARCKDFFAVQQRIATKYTVSGETN